MKQLLKKFGLPYSEFTGDGKTCVFPFIHKLSPGSILVTEHENFLKPTKKTVVRINAKNIIGSKVDNIHLVTRLQNGAKIRFTLVQGNVPKYQEILEVINNAGYSH